MASTAANSPRRRERESDHEGFLVHKRMRWLKVATVLCIAAIVAYAFIDVEPRPNGGTWYGYTLGTVGAGLIVWLALLGIRKRRYRASFTTLQGWVSAHVYLGLAAIVVATLHSGLELGLNLHTLTYLLMLVVVRAVPRYGTAV